MLRLHEPKTIPPKDEDRAGQSAQFTVRKHLSADALIRTVRSSVKQIGETRQGKAEIPMEDALISALAMYSRKDPSLLQFDRCRVEQPTKMALKIAD
jgi:hypothetical protein